jgi:hypothetical protein
MKAAFAVLALGAVLPVSAAAQQLRPDSRTECPVVSGLVVSFSTADSANRQRPVDVGLRADARTVIDTTWTFDIGQRQWTRPFFAASIGAGWAGGQSLLGTTTAPDSSGTKGWSACAGVSIGMRNPTLTLRGARGQVHLRADVRSLFPVSRRDTTSRPQR